MKLIPVRTEFFSYGWTDGQTNRKNMRVAFYNFACVPKIVYNIKTLHDCILKYVWIFDRNLKTKDLITTTIESEFTLYIRNKYRNKLDFRHYIVAAIETTSLWKIGKHSISLLKSLVNRDRAKCLLETSTKKS